MKYTGVPEPSGQVIPGLENLFKSLFFPGMIILGFMLAEASAEFFDKAGSENSLWAWKWAVIYIIAIINAVFLVGMGILAHDAVHKVLFKNSFWNEFAGGLLSGFSLLPFCTNRQFHLTHHSFSHQPDKDPENLFHNMSYYKALIFGALLALKEQYKLLISNTLNRFSESRFRVRIVRDFITTGLVVLVYFYVLPASGFHLSVTVLPMILMLPLVFSYRAISDHYGMPAVSRALATDAVVSHETMDQWHKENKHMQNEITGWVVLTNPLVEWIWSNVNYHEVHHKFPYLSYKYLPQAFHATRNILPYAVRKGYTASLIELRKSSYYSRPDEIKPYLSLPQ